MSDENTLNNFEYASLQLTAQIVSAWTANNSVRPEELLETIHAVHKALSELHNGDHDAKAPEAPVEAPKPAISIKKSVTDDFIYSLFDGQPYKSLKRHLRTSHNMTPEEYRAHFGLPNDYPMVAPGYSKKRSALAITMGLGRKAAE